MASRTTHLIEALLDGALIRRKTLVRQWRARCRRAASADGVIFDWLPWWDNACCWRCVRTCPKRC